MRTLLTASVSGTLPSKDGKDNEAYKITVMFSDGSKTLLRKTYQEFVDLQVTVYDLLKQKGGYSRKTSRTLVSSLPELNSPLSRIMFKDNDLKKMGRIDEFMREMLTLPTVVRESEAVMKFFGAFMEQQETSERKEYEEELKKSHKTAELLSGRGLYTIPDKSPVPSRKKTGYNDSSWIPEDMNLLSRESRENLFKQLNERRPSKPLPGTERPASTSIGSPRPGLRHRPFSVAVGVADILKETVENKPEKARSRSTVTAPDYQSLDIDKQQSNGNENSPGDENSGENDQEEPRIGKISTQDGRRSPRKIKYVAVSSFAAEEDGEVSLEGGEEVDVLQKEASGWWYVKSKLGEGWAPSAYLEPVQSSRSTSPVNLEQSQDVECQEEYNQIDEQSNIVSEETVDKEEQKISCIQDKQKSLNLSSEGQTEKISGEMNRRVKFLMVEGIQKRKNPDKNYVYILKVVWSDGAINIIYRQCSDFFFLQESLKKEFPSAIGKEIPVLKGRKFTENCQFCFKDGTCKRRQFMNQFCHELVNSPDKISNCQAVMHFCKPRSSDVLPHGTNEKASSKNKEGDSSESVSISGPVVFEQYIVIADYQKKNRNDISLSAGDTVDVIERNELGWWLVDREGELGWAPASHLEPTDDGAEITSSKTYAPGQEEVYQSVKSYKAEAEDELSFDVGVMLKVVEKTLDGWWFVRYRGDQGWAPAMNLRKVSGGDSSPTSNGKMDVLDIVSFDGDSEDADGKLITRTPPTRRSMVKRSVRKKPKRNSNPEIHETIPEDQEHSTTEKKGRAISVPATPMTPTVTKRKPPLSKSNSSSRPASGEIPQWAQHQMSLDLSSGYGTSPSGSLSSLASEVFTPEENSPPIKKCATLPRFDDIEDKVVQSAPSPTIPRSQSVTSMAQYKKQMEAAVNGRLQPSGKSSSGRSSPIPTPRKISATNRKSPLAGSLPRIHDLRTSQRESGSDMDYESGQDYRNDLDSPRYQVSSSQNRKSSLLYRAMYAYIAQEEGEATFKEGDLVEVLQRSNNGWYLLSTESGLGWGPSNFLQTVEN